MATYRELVISYITGLDKLDGRYTNMQPVNGDGGGGHFSVVFNARDEHLGSTVVLKFFDPNWDGNHRRKEYFRREAEALQDMGQRRSARHLAEVVGGLTAHRAALPLGDQTLEHTLEYYAMKPYSKTLEQYIYAEDHTPTELITTFREVVAGVHCAHRFGYCHRDLKPDNVLMDVNDCVAVSDFGSAKRLATLASRDLEDYEPAPAGHKFYTSPELLAGLTTVENFFSTDIFALGLILFEMFNRTQFFYKSVGYLALVAHLPQVPVYERSMTARLRKFHEILDAVTSSTPPIRLLQAPIGPPDFVRHVEELFGALTHFDIAKRTQSFEFVFSKTDRCLRALGATGVKREYRAR